MEISWTAASCPDRQTRPTGAAPATVANRRQGRNLIGGARLRLTEVRCAWR
ncbi:hypothetical protein PE067_16845 [Paracoccus sp. DMF-8]|uniref:hypothetical protein n=1 Tax=Paracoccus sp. DMF-8 TaxID=3019445 RepID=UPI0023E47662|nr:hypothetical protein [Paracoccus sp. DMF-8]MDF3607660.1 hypothetical protein [Paracoccus sp. DMF-8]